jgi:pimeloyl-ACP methyl ester carboxylesterase
VVSERSHTVERDGVRLHVHDSGPSTSGSDEAVVLLSGLAMSPAGWDPVAERLVAAGHRVVRPQTRGHAPSDAPPTGYRLADLSADVDTVLGALGTTRVHLVGHSLGGMVAVQVALAHPDRVASLALLGAPIAGQPPAPAFGAWAGRVLRLARDGLPALLAALPDTAAFAHRIPDPALAATVRQQVTTTLRAPAFVGENFADVPAVAAARPNPWQRLRAGELTAPLLVLDGADDPLVGAGAEPTAAHVPDARSVVLLGAGHLALLEQPAAVAGELLAFIAGAQEGAHRDR